MDTLEKIVLTRREKEMFKDEVEKLLENSIYSKFEEMKQEDGSILLTKEWIEAFKTDKINKEAMMKAIGEVIKSFCGREYEKPKFYFTYPDGELSFEKFKEWFDCLQLLYSIGCRYEEKIQTALSVDRTWQKYITPELKKMYSLLTGKEA